MFANGTIVLLAGNGSSSYAGDGAFVLVYVLFASLSMARGSNGAARILQAGLRLSRASPGRTRLGPTAPEAF